jgi:hypothetical protein
MSNHTINKENKILPFELKGKIEYGGKNIILEEIDIWLGENIFRKNVVKVEINLT